MASPVRWFLVLLIGVSGFACGGNGEDGNGRGAARDDDEGGVPTTEPHEDGNANASVRLAHLSRTGDPLALIVTTLRGDDERDTDDAGLAEKVVASDVRSAGGYAWSPDGSEIVYPRFLDGQPGASELVIVSVDGSDEEVLTSDGFDDRYPAFSPDGRRIVFRRGPAREPGSDLYVVDRDGTGLQQLVDDPAAEALFPVWSPDGDRIAYHRFPRDGEAQVEPQLEPQIAVVDADGSNHRIIAEQAVQPAWSPDGELIAFVSSATAGRTSTNLHTMRPDGSDVQQLASDVAGAPVWSPDGERIAFAAQGEQRNLTDLAVIDRDGTGKRVLADLRPHDGSPTWSPNGDSLVFVAAEIEGATDLYIIRLSDGADAQPITSTGKAESPAFALS